MQKLFHAIALLLLTSGCRGQIPERSLARANHNHAQAAAHIPITILEEFSVQISRDGKLAQLKFFLGPDYMYGPVQILSALLSKYPKIQTFKLQWDMSVGSSSDSAKVLYNRHAHTLKFDDAGSMGYYFSENHTLYEEVTDSVIHNAARLGASSQADGGFLSLVDYGCKKRYSHHKNNNPDK